MTATGSPSPPQDPGRTAASNGDRAPEEAARLLFQDPSARVEFTAHRESEARRAVEELARLFDEAPGVFTAALEGARAGAETLTTDRLQGVAEIIQNADDAHASFVHLQIVDNSLVAVHDGDLVTLSDVLALTTPWLSNKTDNEVATGRFGIGLMTLRALSDVLDVHSGPYHIRLGQPTISAIESSTLPLSLSEPDWTAICVPLRPDSVTTDDIAAWMGRWGDGALLFLRSVREVSVLDPMGLRVRTLSLSWHNHRSATCRIAGSELEVLRRRAKARDGRVWFVHSTEAPKPPDVCRVRKAAGATVPLGLALALKPGDRGVIYAGLPVTATSAPLRANTQFDPITSRSDLAPTAWNRALLPLLADLWVGLVKDLFAQDARAAWQAIPLSQEVGPDPDPEGVVHRLEALLLDRARTELAPDAALVVDGDRVLIRDLAVEDAALEGVIEPAEIASLAGLATSLPRSARDLAGRWRAVLDDWRASGAPLAKPVTVADALPLLEDPARSVVATIELAAVALHQGLSARLTDLPCVTTSDGRRIVPPTAESVEVITVTQSRLADQLGVGVVLAPEHLAATEAARTVLAWLRKVGAVIDDPRDEQVVRRLAAAGRAGDQFPEPLSDEQLRALRDAFEQLSVDDRSSLGSDVGRAIRISVFRYDGRGRLHRSTARPGEAYLSRAVDREPDSFAVAADRTPGLLWTDNRYVEQLKSSLGRVGGLGPQKFLGLLGAERAPRLVRHPGLQARYSDPRRGLPLGVTGSPRQRDAAIRSIGATYTLDDVDSPDLRAVVANIASDRKAAHRRDRAGALAGALGRAWDRLVDRADVLAALDDYVWRPRGTVKAFWLWSIGTTEWLDDADGVPKAPLELRLKTPGTLALHGPSAPGYLRPEFDAPNRREVLAALGVSGEPTVRDLVQRLRAIQSSPPQPESAPTDAAMAYQAIAEKLAHRETPAGDLSERDLRTAFAEGRGLVLTDLGWRAPSEVLAGAPIFRRRRAFTPQAPGTERLWAALQIRQPTAEDCLRVVGQIARTRREPDQDDVVVLLETFRRLAELLSGRATASRPLARRLAVLPLWTTFGWTSQRPVYGAEDPTLVDGLRAEVPVWLPGGDLAQFEALLAPMRITRLATEKASMVAPECGVRDDDATELLSAAVSLLQDDLARNDARTAGALRIAWDELSEFEVRVDPDLRVRVDGLIGRPPVEVDTASKADIGLQALFLRERRLLRQVDAGGRSIAGLFAVADQRQLAQAWLAACIAAEEGRTGQRLRLAAEEAAAERAAREREMAERTAALGEDIAKRQKGRRKGRADRSGKEAESGAQASAQPPKPPQRQPRVLVDPATLVVLNPEGRRGAKAASTATSRGGGRSKGLLRPPDRRGSAPRGGMSAPTFTPLDKESVGMALVRTVLAGDEEEIADLRAQHGVGADAIDKLDRFFELKVHLGDEPDVIHLEESEVRRALSTPDFFLVVVSGVEGANARPRVRIIVDPVHQLTMQASSTVIFTGVRGAQHSLVYDLGPAPDADDSSEVVE
jgi:hypothetical protein